MEHSELVAEVLGEHVFDFFLRNKRAEWEDYRRRSRHGNCAPHCPPCEPLTRGNTLDRSLRTPEARTR